MAESLSFKIISKAAETASDQGELFEKTYKLWKELFVETLEDIKGEKVSLYSDEFLLQDEMGVLLYHNDPIGLIGFSRIKTRSCAFMDRSYFQNYSRSVLEEIKNRHREIFIISNLAVHPQYRKSMTGKSYSNLLVGLGVLSFINSTSCALVTITRNNRKTHQTVSMFGGKSLEKQKVHGIDSDVMTIEKEEAVKSFSMLPNSTLKDLEELYRGKNGACAVLKIDDTRIFEDKIAN